MKVNDTPPSSGGGNYNPKYDRFMRRYRLNRKNKNKSQENPGKSFSEALKEKMKEDEDKK